MILHARLFAAKIAGTLLLVYAMAAALRDVNRAMWVTFKVGLRAIWSI